MKTETTRAGEFLLSAANGDRSFESVTVTGGPYEPGQVMSKITASGKFTAYTGSGTTGTQTAAGVLYRGADGSGSDASGVVVARDATVSAELLIGGDADSGADLEAVGIIAR